MLLNTILNWKKEICSGVFNILLVHLFQIFALFYDNLSITSLITLYTQQLFQTVTPSRFNPFSSFDIPNCILTSKQSLIFLLTYINKKRKQTAIDLSSLVILPVQRTEKYWTRSRFHSELFVYNRKHWIDISHIIAA